MHAFRDPEGTPVLIGAQNGAQNVRGTFGPLPQRAWTSFVGAVRGRREERRERLDGLGLLGNR